MITIDGQSIPAPTDYAVSVLDIDSGTARTASGLMVRKRIAVKRKLELAWKFLTKAELAEVLNAVSPVYVVVRYVDAQTGSTKTGTFYAGDRNAGALDYSNGQIRWKDVKFNLIER